MAVVGLGRGTTVVVAADSAVVYPGVVFRVLADELLPLSVIWSAQNDNPVLRRFMSLARSRVLLEQPVQTAGT